MVEVGGDGGKRRWVRQLIIAGVAILIVLLALILYHPRVVPPPLPTLRSPMITLVIYNPSNESTANPHVQPVTMSCSSLQSFWSSYFGYVPTCQEIADDVSFIENNTLLSAYPVVSGGSITWWVRMPGIPPKTNVTITMILGKPESITSPQNVFLIYGNISSFQPGYIYVFNVTGRGITILYNPSGVGSFIYAANGSTWLFTPKTNPSSSGFNAQSGFASVASLPNGQYLIGVVQNFYAPLNTTYQSVPSITITHIPQSVLDALSGLGAAYVTPLVNPPPYNGSLVLVSEKPFYIQLPQCNITRNPYTGPSQTGGTGVFNLMSCLAIKYGGVWAVIHFYYPPGAQGALLGISENNYPALTGYHAPLVYVGSSGNLYAAEYPGVYMASNPFPLSPGWHTAIFGEYYSGGFYHVVIYVDNPSNTWSGASAYMTIMYGGYVTQAPYGYIGVGPSQGWPGWPYTNGGWFFYDGVIAFVALFGGGVNESSFLINKGVFNIAGTQGTTHLIGYAIDYPPNGIEPIVISTSVNTTTGLVALPPGRLGVINYEVHVASPAGAFPWW